MSLKSLISKVKGFFDDITNFNLDVYRTDEEIIFSEDGTPEGNANNIILSKLALLNTDKFTARYVVFPKECSKVDLVRLCLDSKYYPRYLIVEYEYGYGFYGRCDLIGNTRVAYPDHPIFFHTKGDLTDFISDKYGVTLAI